MPDLTSLPDDLTDREWLSAVQDIGKSSGFAESLDDNHHVVFGMAETDSLFVGFETVAGARSLGADGLPLAMSLGQRCGWSHLSLLARRDSWWRKETVWRFFDERIDNGFFENFDRIVFYGAGPAGYAAAAYSVAAPGSTVIAIAPQATLNPDRAGWDERFAEHRALDFTSRYGFAPEMTEAANCVFVVYDPAERLDAMHASLFHGRHVHRIRHRRGGPGAIDADLRTLGVFERLLKDAAKDTLSAQSLYQGLRARHRHTPWLRAALARVMAENRPFLTGLFCRAALRQQNVPRFSTLLDEAERELARAGRRLPPEAGNAPQEASGL